MLFADPIAAGKDYFKRTGIFPIMHITGIRRELVDKHPWLPAAVFKAFSQSKAKCLEALEDTAATKVTLPFVEDQLRLAREFMGEDFWSYGLEPNRKVIETFLQLPPQGGAVIAAGEARGAVPSLDARELRDLIAARDFPARMLRRRRSRRLEAWRPRSVAAAMPSRRVATRRSQDEGSYGVRSRPTSSAAESGSVRSVAAASAAPE